MDPFIDVFLKVNTNRSGSITIDELTNYVEKNSLDKDMIIKWRNLFDPTNTGKITLEKFCDVLGLKAAEVIKKREAFYQSQGPRLGDDIHVIFENMPLDQQVIISDEVRKRTTGAEADGKLHSLSVDMKRYLDDRFGPSWQVFVVEGNYWVTHTFLPNTSFQFNLHDRSYLFWQIPE
ncbi:hypothetical protein P879_02911 [Paragonimus westermani]|uniref:EF-hand domain-containing protein n=1 Tax=Paragonimus westermani TaxID=34504 RepID=A0A8T0DI69_9TREM|nr:hypothetical protein P879_02911 [Paragonimus westermani]